MKFIKMTYDIGYDKITFSHLAETDKYSGTFYSASGEEYGVSLVCRATAGCDYTYRRHSENCNLTITWKKKSLKFIGIRAYEVTSKNSVCEKQLFVNNPVSSATFTVKCPRNRSVFYAINILLFPSITKSSNDKQSLEYRKNGKNKKQICTKNLKELSTNLKKLMQTGALSDIYFINANDKINMRKLMLSARKILEQCGKNRNERKSRGCKRINRMKKNQEGVIATNDTSFEIFTDLMDYVFRGTVKIDDMKTARDLYIAADKYDVQSLKAICLKLLLCVDLDNVLDNLLLAALYEDKIMKEAAMKFIANNYPQMKDRPEWKSFMVENQTLANETLNFVLHKKN